VRKEIGRPISGPRAADLGSLPSESSGMAEQIQQASRFETQSCDRREGAGLLRHVRNLLLSDVESIPKYLSDLEIAN